jgi:hypothetical protein
VDGLDSLTRPFEEKEMDDVIKHMPVDRAPRPDGFNGLFLKKCWSIIKADIYKLAADFHSETVQLKISMDPTLLWCQRSKYLYM